MGVPVGMNGRPTGMTGMNGRPTGMNGMPTGMNPQGMNGVPVAYREGGAEGPMPPPSAKACDLLGWVLATRGAETDALSCRESKPWTTKGKGKAKGKGKGKVRCGQKVGFKRASDVCKAAGGRMCQASELNQAGVPLACVSASASAWTSSACEKLDGTAGVVLFTASSNTTRCASSGAGAHVVKCCADFAPDAGFYHTGVTFTPLKSPATPAVAATLTYRWSAYTASQVSYLTGMDRAAAMATPASSPLWRQVKVRVPHKTTKSEIAESRQNDYEGQDSGADPLLAGAASIQMANLPTGIEVVVRVVPLKRGRRVVKQAAFISIRTPSPPTP